MVVVFELCTLTEKKIFCVLTLAFVLFVSSGVTSQTLDTAIVLEKREQAYSASKCDF